MDLKKILIIIIVLLAIVELYILTSSEPETAPVMQIPVVPDPTPKAATNNNQAVSYPSTFEQETIDESWAKVTEVQIANTAEKLSTKYASYFKKISSACKNSICKIELTTEASNQPFPILVADFVNSMKGQGWLADVEVLTENVSGDTTSGRAIIYLVNPTR